MTLMKSVVPSHSGPWPVVCLVFMGCSGSSDGGPDGSVPDGSVPDRYIVEDAASADTSAQSDSLAQDVTQTQDAGAERDGREQADGGDATPAADSATIDATTGDAPTSDARGSDGPAEDVTDAGTSDAASGSPDSGSRAFCSGPLSCGPGAKLCNGVCPSVLDPAYGCAGTSCSPCSGHHAAWSCDAAGACAVAACDPGWRDCNGNAQDGCEADLSSAATCNGCATSCTGTSNLCSPTGCVSSCAFPLTPCGTGCVNLSDSASNCGSCGAVCPAGCNHGACGADCSASPNLTACGTQCVDLTRDPNNCGTCSTPCSSAAGTPLCVQSKCTTMCAAGYTGCNRQCVVTDTDVANCGACGNPCSANQVCVSSACVPAASLWLATGLGTPTSIAIDDAGVYWTDKSFGAIASVPKSGGAVHVVASAQSSPSGIKLDGDYAYWTTVSNAIMRGPKAAMMPQVVLVSGGGPILGIDATYVYFFAAGALHRVPKAGGSDTPYASGTPSNFLAMISDGTAAFGFSPFSAPSSYLMYQVDLSSGAATQISGELQQITSPSRLFIDANCVYEPVNAFQNWQCIPRAAGVQVSDLSEHGETFLGPGGCGYFWGGPAVVGASSDLVFSTVQSPGGAVVLPASAVSPVAIVVDGTTLYWADSGGAIGKLALPLLP
jgi:hypothetical protein